MRLGGLVRIGRFALLGIAALSAAPATAFELGTPATSTTEAASAFGSGPGGYERLLIEPLNVLYTAEFLLSDQGDLQFEDSDVERIRRYYRDVVTTQLAAYPIALEPGPRVLRLDGALIDPVLDKRNWLVPTRFLFRVAPRLQLVVLLRDSRTDEIVDRVGLMVRPQANRLMQQSPGSYWHFMRRVLGRMATRVRWSLEQGDVATGLQGG